MPADSTQVFSDRLKTVSGHMGVVHPAAVEDMQFAAGGPGQWDKKDYKRLRDQNRPALSIDQVGPTVHAVSGSETVNRFEAKFLPRNTQLEDIDTIASETIGEVYKWAWQVGGMEHHVSRAYRDTAKTGYGWTETFLDFEESPDGNIKTQWLPQFEMGFDPDARAMNLADAKYLIRGKWLTEDDFAFAFPDAAKDGAISAIGQLRGDTFPGGFMSRSGTAGEDYDDTLRASTVRPWFDSTARRMLVYEHQYFERERQFYVNVPPQFPQFAYGDDLTVVNPGRQWVEQDDFDDFMIGAETMLTGLLPEQDMVRQAMSTLQSDVEFLPRRIYRQDFHAGPIELDAGLAQINRFTYQCITGFENQGDPSQMHWMGLVESMKDPQRLVNKLISSVIWLIQQNPNALLYERNSFVDPENALRNINDPSANVELVEGSLRDGRVQARLGRNPLPSGIGDMLSFATDAIPRTTGVNPFFSGMVGDLRRTPAASVQSVQRQAMVILSVLMDSLRQYRKEHAEIVLMFMRHLRPDTIARVINPDLREQGAENIIYNTDISEYDVTIEEAPTSASRGEELRRDLMQNGFLVKMLENGMPPPPDIFENMGLPSSTAAQMKQAAQLLWDRQMAALQADPQQAQPGAEQPPA